MAENTSGDPQLAVAIKSFAPFAPHVAGSVLSMAFGEKLTWRGKALSVILGLACAMWIAPLGVAVAGLWWPGGAGSMPRQVGDGIAFFCGLFGMLALGGAAPFIAKFAGDPFGFVRLQVGGVSVGRPSGEGA